MAYDPPPKDSPALDLSNRVNLRVFLESLRNQQEGELASWTPHWQELGSFCTPRGMRWNILNADRGERKDLLIINNCATVALRTLKAGMQNGMSNPAGIWFRIGLSDEDLDSRPEVRQWCEDTEEKIRRCLVGSNFYECMLNMYGECGLFGTSAFLIEADRNPDDDANTIIRCKPYPIGEYTLSCNDQLRVDMSVRKLAMTARQIREQYGYAITPDSTKTLIDSPSGGTKETWREMVHCIMRSSYFGEQAKRITPMPWVSIQYELDAFDPENAVMTKSGYFECPLIVGRWDVVGENVYGESPGMDALGDVMSLQSWEDRMAYGVDVMSKPHMLASTKVAQDARKSAMLPGDITWVDADTTKDLFTPAFQVPFAPAVEATQRKIDAICQRIDKAFYKDVFLMIDQAVTRQTTAEEIRARWQEKMQVIGPVVERMIGETHAPAIRRVYGIMKRWRGPRGESIFKPMPAAMQGRPMKLKFESILAQAARSGKVANITQWMGIAGNLAGVAPQIMDNVDVDEAMQESGALLSVPNKLIRPPDQVAAMRKQKADQQAQADRADQSQKMAQAAATLANAPANGQSLLNNMPGLQGGTQ